MTMLNMTPPKCTFIECEVLANAGKALYCRSWKGLPSKGEQPTSNIPRSVILERTPHGLVVRTSWYNRVLAKYNW